MSPRGPILEKLNRTVSTVRLIRETEVGIRGWDSLGRLPETNRIWLRREKVIVGRGRHVNVEKNGCELSVRMEGLWGCHRRTAVDHRSAEVRTPLTCQYPPEVQSFSKWVHRLSHSRGESSGRTMGNPFLTPDLRAASGIREPDPRSVFPSDPRVSRRHLFPSFSTSLRPPVPSSRRSSRRRGP